MIMIPLPGASLVLSSLPSSRTGVSTEPKVRDVDGTGDERTQDTGSYQSVNEVSGVKSEPQGRNLQPAPQPP